MNKELGLLNLIGTKEELSQREYAKLIDVSLGTVNNMIQAFENENIITMNKLSPRKVYYVLTKKGKEYQNSLYVDYISSCFDTIANVRKTFKENLHRLVDEGVETFYIEGDTDELVRLAKMIFFEISRKHTISYTLLSEVDNSEELLSCIKEEDKSKHAIVGWSTTSKFELKYLTYMNLLT